MSEAKQEGGCLVAIIYLVLLPLILAPSVVSMASMIRFRNEIKACVARGGEWSFPTTCVRPEARIPLDSLKVGQ